MEKKETFDFNFENNFTIENERNKEERKKNEFSTQPDEFELRKKREKESMSRSRMKISLMKKISIGRINHRRIFDDLFVRLNSTCLKHFHFI